MEMFKTLSGDEVVCHAHISDIHFGAMSPLSQYEYLKQFMFKLKEIKPDIVFLNGDLFHKASYLAGSEPIYYAMKFIEDLANFCIDTNCSLVILQGTLSHDGKQLRLFERYYGIDNLDIHLITEGTVLNIKGMQVTCIPEMYNMGSEYYRKLLIPNTHLTVVHGMLKDAIPQAAINSNGLDDRAPVFELSDFKNTKLIIGGHIHNRTHDLSSKFIYSGSPYSWQFGPDGDEAKGFHVVYQNISSKEYTIEFHEISSPKYITLNIDKYLIKGMDAKEIIDEVFNTIQKLGGQNAYRLEITTASTSNMNIIKVLRNYYSNTVYNRRYVSLKINKIDEFEEAKESFLEKNKKYSFIVDKSLTPYDKLSIFINMQYNTQIEPNELEEIIKKE